MFNNPWYLVAKIVKCSNGTYNHLVGKQVTLDANLGFWSLKGWGQVSAFPRECILDGDYEILLTVKKKYD